MPRHATRSRLRPYILAALAILTIIYVTTGPSTTQTSEFYTRTVAVMDARQKQLREGLTGVLNPAEDKAAKAQAAAEAKVRDSTGQKEIIFDQVKEHGGGKGEQVSGKDKVAAAAEELKNQVDGARDKAKQVADKVVGKTGEETDAVSGLGGKKVQGKGDEDDGVAKVGNTGKNVGGKADAKGAKSGKDDQIEALLDGILKKSPVIIFSKTFCPYSKKAKHILLDGYKIVPAPYVAEIDLLDKDDPEAQIGKRLQDKLYSMTKRRTVPNVLINAVSIGGGDDIEQLDEEDKLAAKIIEIGGKRIMEVKKLSP